MITKNSIIKPKFKIGEKVLIVEEYNLCLGFAKKIATIDAIFIEDGQIFYAVYISGFLNNKFYEVLDQNGFAENQLIKI